MTDLSRNPHNTTKQVKSREVQIMNHEEKAEDIIFANWLHHVRTELCMKSRESRRARSPTSPRPLAEVSAVVCPPSSAAERRGGGAGD